jgi:GT2 family glycosyltransferase
MPERIVLPDPAAPRVSILIPATAGPELLLACLRSLERHGPRGIPFETLVVLNAARDEDEARLRETVTGVRWAGSPVNLGLAGAGNRGRALARGELLVLLHDDAEVEPGWLEALVAAADRHPEAGAIGGKVLFPDGRLQNAGMILWRNATTSPPWAGETPAASAASAFDRPRAVDYCGTSSLLVRATAWDAAGGLDERFFPVYFVDVDLAMAIRRRGQIVLYEPGSVIRHHQGASGNLRFRVFVTQRNRRRFLKKWGSALAEHEPREEGPAAAVEGATSRAILRAEAFAERVRRAGAPAPETSPERPAFDAGRQERLHLEMDLELHRAYVAHLASLLETREEAVPAGELAGLRARSATLAAIESGRWWRLYQRLLPFLRRFR